MTVEIIVAVIGLLAAIAGAVAWYFRGRGDRSELAAERALNASILQHQRDVRLSITEAERRAEGGRHVAERALAGSLPADALRELRSGRLPGPDG